jgi:hypothetical protein
MLLVITVSACATLPPAPQSWESCHCDWLAQQASELAGPDMIDCGFVNLVGVRPRAEIRGGISCAREAFRNSAPFRYGSVRIPLDSYATEVLVRHADGSLWLLVHDVMLDGAAPQYWVHRCEKLRFKPGNTGFVIESCKTEKESKM